MDEEDKKEPITGKTNAFVGAKWGDNAPVRYIFAATDSEMHWCRWKWLSFRSRKVASVRAQEYRLV